MNDASSAGRPLHRDLLAASALLGAVLGGESLASALPRQAASARWNPAQRGAAQALVFQTLRSLGRARALLALLYPKRLKPAALEHLLLVAIALLSSERPPYAAHTLVDQAVQACGSRPTTRAARGLVNALLRRLLQELPALLEQALRHDEARYNHPQWWIDKLRAAYPEQWQSILLLAERQPAMSLRVNARWGSRDAYLELLRATGIDAIAPQQPGLEQALVLAQGVPVGALPQFEQGAVSVQDCSAQRAAALLDVQPGMRVLDACAAPGGKTAHILERADCDLLALDQDAERAARITDNLQRLRLPPAHIAVADAGDVDRWWDGRRFDRILLDAPCSAAGIVRRHPDIRWLRQADDIDRLAVQQQRLLDALWPLLAPGGRLLYATCSVFPDEGARQAQAFLSRQSDALAWAAPGQILPAADPDQDGFFYALFAKPAPA